MSTNIRKILGSFRFFHNFFLCQEKKISTENGKIAKNDPKIDKISRKFAKNLAKAKNSQKSGFLRPKIAGYFSKISIAV